MKALIDEAGSQLIRRRFADASELIPTVYASLVDYLAVKELLRAGPFDAAACANASLDDIDPEKVINYEAGLRTTWLDGRLRFNPTGYYMVWSNRQSSQQQACADGGTRMTAGAGPGEAGGFGLRLCAALEGKADVVFRERGRCGPRTHQVVELGAAEASCDRILTVEIVQQGGHEAGVLLSTPDTLEGPRAVRVE